VRKPKSSSPSSASRKRASASASRPWAAHLGERDLRRRARHSILGPDGLARLECEPLGFLEPAELDEHLCERTLRFTQLTAASKSFQRTLRIAQQLLPTLELALRNRGATDIERHRRLAQRVADLAVELACGDEGRFRLDIVAAVHLK
jgi:hypothetical protein